MTKPIKITMLKINDQWFNICTIKDTHYFKTI